MDSKKLACAILAFCGMSHGHAIDFIKVRPGSQAQLIELRKSVSKPKPHQIRMRWGFNGDGMFQHTFTPVDHRILKKLLETHKLPPFREVLHAPSPIATIFIQSDTGKNRLSDIGFSETGVAIVTTYTINQRQDERMYFLLPKGLPLIRSIMERPNPNWIDFKRRKQKRKTGDGQASSARFPIRKNVNPTRGDVYSIPE